MERKGKEKAWEPLCELKKNKFQTHTAAKETETEKNTQREN